MLKLYFTYSLSDLDMFWSILIIFRELLNISKVYIKSWMDY
jgi:hypothetical protein